MKNPLQLQKYSRLARTSSALVLTLASGLLFALMLIGSPAVSQPPMADVAGLWIDHTGRGAVEIKPCGANLCGHIAWLKEPNQPNGKPLVDKKGRPVCGLQIIGEVKRQSDGSWDGGWIYDPEEDEQYSVELKLRSPDSLQVLGYLGVKLLGETYVWKRAPQAQERCKAA